MKSVVLGIALAGASFAALPAYANNRNVEETIRNRSDLSSFYQVLLANGVFADLQDDKEYTVFAPDDRAFAKLSRETYTCFYNGTCPHEAIPILRNHFVVGNVSDEDIIHMQAALESINEGREIRISQPSKSDYAVEGNHIVSMSSIYGGKLYKIDGVIMDRNELMALANPQPASEKIAAAPPAHAEQPMCEMEDCSDQKVMAAAAPPAIQPTPMPIAETPVAPEAGNIPVAPDPMAADTTQHALLPWQRPAAPTPPAPQVPSEQSLREAQRPATVADVFEPPEAQPYLPHPQMADAQSIAKVPHKELHVLRLPDPKTAVAEPPPSPPVAAPYVEVASKNLPPLPATPDVITAAAATPASVGPVGGPVQLIAQTESEQAVAQAQPAFTQMASAQSVPAHLASIAPAPHASYTAINFRSPAAD